MRANPVTRKYRQRQACVGVKPETADTDKANLQLNALSFEIQRVLQEWVGSRESFERTGTIRKQDIMDFMAMCHGKHRGQQNVIATT